jgi:pimeloyl-ACP methyl ester carboxylesterase
VHAYNEVVPILQKADARVIVPHLRGFGPTHFLSAETMRSGQQAALGRDVIGLLDALQVPTAVLAGFDWGGLASCVSAALWPERVTGLVSYAGYDVVDINRLGRAFQPSLECAMWYHNYRFHFGLQPGDPRLEPLEQRLAQKPKITVPAITLDGTSDPLKPGGTADHAQMFVGKHEHRVIEGGHALPHEAPAAFAEAVLTVHRWTTDPERTSPANKC